MSKEKQIKEIATILLEASRQNSKYEKYSTAYKAFDTDTIVEYGCDRLNGATALYNAGYRKESENTVEVVRCKDCERRNKSADLTDTIYCSYLKLTMPKDAFCSYGERRKE